MSLNLIILDGIMPKKNGKEVYDVVNTLVPQMKVIFMSGYSEEIFSLAGMSDKSAGFIQKPAKPNELLMKVREALDGS